MFTLDMTSESVVMPEGAFSDRDNHNLVVTPLCIDFLAKVEAAIKRQREESLWEGETPNQYEERMARCAQDEAIQKTEAGNYDKAYLEFLEMTGEAYHLEVRDNDLEVDLLEGQTPYEVLGVSSDADLITAKVAYRSLRSAFHPDKVKGVIMNFFPDVISFYDLDLSNFYNIKEKPSDVEAQGEETMTFEVIESDSLLNLGEKLSAEKRLKIVDMLKMKSDLEAKSKAKMHLVNRAWDQFKSGALYSDLVGVCSDWDVVKEKKVDPIFTELLGFKAEDICSHYEINLSTSSGTILKKPFHYKEKSRVRIRLNKDFGPHLEGDSFYFEEYKNLPFDIAKAYENKQISLESFHEREMQEDAYASLFFGWGEGNIDDPHHSFLRHEDYRGVIGLQNFFAFLELKTKGTLNPFLLRDLGDKFELNSEKISLLKDYLIDKKIEEEILRDVFGINEVFESKPYSLSKRDEVKSLVSGEAEEDLLKEQEVSYRHQETIRSWLREIQQGPVYNGVLDHRRYSYSESFGVEVSPHGEVKIYMPLEDDGIHTTVLRPEDLEIMKQVAFSRSLQPQKEVLKLN